MKTSSPTSPYGQRPQRLGVDDLGEVVVLVDVHAGLAEALVGHAGAAHLGEAVDVERVLAEAGLDLHAELVGPGLGAVEADAQRQVLGPQAAVARRVGQVHGVGRRAAQGGGAEVAHDLELPLGVAAGDGHDGAAQALGAEVQAEPAGEEAVAEGVLEQVARRHAAGGEGPGDQVGPQRRCRRACSPTVVGLPVVPELACTRTTSSRGRANMPNG